MAEFNASSLTDQIQELTDYINDEAASATKSVRSAWVMLIVVCAILGIYFIVIHGQVETATEPEVLAKEAAIFLDDNIPDVAGMMEDVINDSAPQVADFIANKFTQQAVPYLVQRAEEALDGYIHNMAGETAGYMEGAFNDVLTNNKEAIEAAIDEERGGDEPSQALRPLRDQLHTVFTDQTSGRRTEAGRSVDKSLIALRNLNRRLNEMATVDPDSLDRRDAMGSRLLRTYWQWLHHTNPDDAGVQAPSEPIGL